MDKIGIVIDMRVWKSTYMLIEIVDVYIDRQVLVTLPTVHDSHDLFCFIIDMLQIPYLWQWQRHTYPLSIAS